MGGKEVDETELMKPTDEYSGEQSAENEASVVPKVFTDLSHLTSQSPQPVQMQQPAALLLQPHRSCAPPLEPPCRVVPRRVQPPKGVRGEAVGRRKFSRDSIYWV